MGEETELREQDKWLPIANVYRIMKNALPKNAKVSKEAKECVQECVSEFVSFITSEASEKCYAEKRKTVNGEDILYAMASLGFENYAEVLKIYLTKYREYQNNKEKIRREAANSAAPQKQVATNSSASSATPSANSNNYSADQTSNQALAESEPAVGANQASAEGGADGGAGSNSASFEEDVYDEFHM